MPGRGKGVVRYTGTLAMVIESALPYSVAGFALLVSYCIGRDVSIPFGAFYGMFTVSRVCAQTPHFERK